MAGSKGADVARDEEIVAPLLVLGNMNFLM